MNRLSNIVRWLTIGGCLSLLMLMANDAVCQTTGENDEPTSGKATVLHAGGAVRLEIPEDWEVAEIPVNRQIRLTLTPEKSVEGDNNADDSNQGRRVSRLATDVDGSDDQRKDLINGMWLSLTYHRKDQRLMLEDDLLDFARTRLDKLSYGKATVSNATTVSDKSGRWAVIELETPSFSHFSSDSFRRRDQEKESGLYLVQQVEWAELEVFFSWSGNSATTVNEQVGEIVGSIRLERPKGKRGRIKRAVKDAVRILGSWKSSRGRMQLQGDGVIRIVTDDPFEVEVVGAADVKTRTAKSSSAELAAGNDASTRREDDEPLLADTIEGTFKARDDLLFTVWQDGSKLNYRWRLHNGALLLTDSEGRTSKLLPIAD